MSTFMIMVNYYFYFKAFVSSIINARCFGFNPKRAKQTIRPAICPNI